MASTSASTTAAEPKPAAAETKPAEEKKEAAAASSPSPKKKDDKAAQSPQRFSQKKKENSASPPAANGTTTSSSPPPKKQEPKPTSTTASKEPAPAAARTTSTQSQQKPASTQRSTSQQPSQARAASTERGRSSVGPPLPEQVTKMAKMTPLERVRAAYAEAKKIKAASFKPSASMKSGTSRDPYSKSFPAPAVPPKALVTRESSLIERTNSVAQKIHYDPTRTHIHTDFDVPKQAASASWSKSSAPRSTFLYNWTRFPRNTPTSDCASSTPGPGAYTSPLFCVGM